MREAVGIARSEDKAPSKLKRIPPRFVLAMAGCPRPCSRCGVVAAKQMQQVRGFQFCGSISQPLLVDQQRKRDPGFLAEIPRVLTGSPFTTTQSSSILLILHLVLAPQRATIAT